MRGVPWGSRQLFRVPWSSRQLLGSHGALSSCLRCHRNPGRCFGCHAAPGRYPEFPTGFAFKIKCIFFIMSYFYEFLFDNDTFGVINNISPDRFRNHCYFITIVLLAADFYYCLYSVQSDARKVTEKYRTNMVEPCETSKVDCLCERLLITVQTRS